MLRLLLVMMKMGMLRVLRRMKRRGEDSIGHGRRWRAQLLLCAMLRVCVLLWWMRRRALLVSSATSLLFLGRRVVVIGARAAAVTSSSGAICTCPRWSIAG